MTAQPTDHIRQHSSAFVSIRQALTFGWQCSRRTRCRPWSRAPFAGWLLQVGLWISSHNDTCICLCFTFIHVWVEEGGGGLYHISPAFRLAARSSSYTKKKNTKKRAFRASPPQLLAPPQLLLCSEGGARAARWFHKPKHLTPQKNLILKTSFRCLNLKHLETSTTSSRSERCFL